MMNCPHCETEVDEHEANRCLDAWVAETVMKFRYIDISLNDEQRPLVPPEYTLDSHPNSLRREDGDAWWWGKDIHCLVPNYSTDIAAVWEVVGSLKEKKIGLIIWTASDIVQAYRIDLDGDYLADEQAEMPLAICRAAIKAAYVGD